MDIPLVTNIQKFCVHDGGGIRTTVFFKGCSLRCQWCHNPEAQSFERELMFYSERCAGCGSCLSACKQGAIAISEGLVRTDPARCTACGECVPFCFHEARSLMGAAYPLDELTRLLCRDSMFYETSGGGVTLSGGEVMQQPFPYVLALAKRLHDRGIHVSVDTCGDAPYERFMEILPYTDEFLYDLKHIDPVAHKRFTGVDNARILSNLAALSRDGARIWVRIPLVPGVNDGEKVIGGMIDFLRANVRAERVSLLPYHVVGADKYARLGKKPPSGIFHPPEPASVEAIANRFRQAGFAKVRIGG